MSTWGSYLASYVKKKPAAATTGEVASNIESPPKTETGPEKVSIKKIDIAEYNALPPAVTAPNPPTVKKTSDGFQRANSSANNATAKKLYDISVPTPNEQPSVMKDVLAANGQKTGTNASRVARMFGYAANTYTAPTTTAETKKKPPPMKPLFQVPDSAGAAARNTGMEQPPLSPLMQMVQDANAYPAPAGAKTKSTKPPLSPLLLVPGSRQEGMTPPLSPLMAMVQKASLKKEEPKMKPAVDAVLKYSKENTSTAVGGDEKKKTKKDEVQDMLDFFASQLDTPSSDVLALPSDTKRMASSPDQKVEKGNMAGDNTKRNVVVKKPSAMAMLDFFSSQLKADTGLSAVPVDGKKMDSKPEVKEEKKQGSIDMLDFFAGQLESKDDMLALPGDRNLRSLKPVSKVQPQPIRTQDTSPNLPPYNDTLQAKSYIPPVTRKDSGWSSGSQSSSTSQDLKNIMSSPNSKTSSRQTSRTSSELSSAMSGNGRKNSIWSQQTSPTSSIRATSIKKRTSRVEQSGVQIRGKILSYAQSDEEMLAEKKRRDAEHDRMVELQEQAERIILEKEEMERERDRMMEEQAVFEREAERIREEAESMRKFVEDVERERRLDEENREKKRRRKEAEEEERREREMEERRRQEAEEEERRKREMEERRRQEDEEEERRKREMEERRRQEDEEEEERRRLQAADERREAEFAAELEAERAAMEMDKERNRIAELKRKKQYQDEADRLAKEEADRLTAEMKQYEADQEADRQFYAEEEEKKRDIARQKDLDRQEYEADQQRKREAGRQRQIAAMERQKVAERMRYENQAEQERKAIEQERFEEEQRRAAAKRADQLFKEEQQRRFFEDEQQRRILAQEQERRMLAQEQERQYYEQQQANQRYQQQQAARARFAGADRLANDYRNNLDINRQPTLPMLSPSVYSNQRYAPSSYEEEERGETKEEKLAKAEKKIQQAFAGLAAERERSIASSSPPGSVASGPTGGMPRSNTVRNERGPGGYGGFGMKPGARQEGGVSRFNTTGGPAKLQKRLPQAPMGKAGSVTGRTGGLPSGPRGAGGLPSGPRPVRR